MAHSTHARPTRSDLQAAFAKRLRTTDKHAQIQRSIAPRPVSLVKVTDQEWIAANLLADAATV